MAKNTYEQINKILMGNRPEFHFHPKVLDDLTEDERNDIESRLARSYLLGNTSALKYFPHFKYFNGGEILKKVNVKDLSVPALANYYSTLYLCTKEEEYLGILLSSAESDIDSFRALIEIYNALKDARIKENLDRIYQSTKDVDYKFLYEKMINVEDIDDAIEKVQEREELHKKAQEYFSFQAGDLNMLGKDGKPLSLQEQQLIIKLERELYLREHPEERENGEGNKSL